MDKNQGYSILKAVMLENGRGFALGHHPTAPSPYVTWACYDDKNGQRIRISTWPYGFKGIYGYRNFTIEDEMGNPLVRADSTWFYYDLEKGCPVRVPESQLEGYQIEDKPLAMPPAPKKIRLPETYETAAPVTVERHHLDTNRHVNNAQYVAIARELLPVDFALGELRVEYRKAAMLGDVMYPKLAQVPEGYVVSLQDAEGQVYANLWLARTGL